jgi:hypothetical protein
VRRKSGIERGEEGEVGEEGERAGPAKRGGREEGARLAGRAAGMAGMGAGRGGGQTRREAGLWRGEEKL